MPVSDSEVGNHADTYILSIPDAAEMLPSKRNHGLNPSEDFA